MDSIRVGKQGEDYAAGILEQQGHRILSRNWSCRWGEIDLVTRQGNTICFVEVKTRRRGAMVTPFEAVGLHKRRRIIRSAMTYLAENPSDLQPRFDVFAVYHDGKSGIYHWDYMTGAFDSEEVDSFG